MVNELESLQSIQSTITALNDTVESLESTVTSVSSVVDELSTNIDSIKTTVGSLSESVGELNTDIGALSEDVDAVKTTVNSVSDAVDELNTDIDSIQSSLDNLAEPIETITNNGGITRFRQANEDNYATSTTIFFYELNYSTFEWTINLYDYIIMGYTIHSLYTTNAEDVEGDPYTDTTTDYVTMRDSDTYVYIMPRSTVYKGEGHYHFIIRLTNSRVEQFPDLVDMFVIGRFSNRSRCYILNETQYNRLTNASTHNPYELVFPLVSYDSSTTDSFVTNNQQPAEEHVEEENDGN